MAKIKSKTDKVRASRDGHEFHENWAARKALQLIFPKDDLVGIAVEGVAPEDQADSSAATVEIADLAFYYGKTTKFSQAREVRILQLKYSVAGKTKPFRCSDASKTIFKFAETFKDLKKKHGQKDVLNKLRFEIVTNRPILPALEKAIQGIQKREILKGEAKTQESQVISACDLKGNELVQFAKRISFTGLAGNLSNNKSGLSKAIANWSAGRDPVSRARLGALQQLLRDKAGTAGDNKNVVRKIDVLATMDVEEADLFPCPESFPNIGPIVIRDQLSEATALISSAVNPILIHASGGVGKTVFLQSIAAELSKENQVVVFDCFGGGNYRSPEDGRHLPKNGLAHIANTFARSGLCDPLIPSNTNSDDLVKAFRSRLSQSIEAIRTASPKKKIFLFLDAADNAAEFAKELHEPCFPKLLLESFAVTGPVSGVQLVLSCRPERKDLVKGEVDCKEYMLKPFTIQETTKFLAPRVKNLKQTEIQVAQARSEGNPRIKGSVPSIDTVR